LIKIKIRDTPVVEVEGLSRGREIANAGFF
jgi:hypothetical protein